MAYIADEQKFKDLLNQEYSWPARYRFKFIVKASQVQEVENLFAEGVDIVHKPSSGGKYISLSIQVTMGNAEEIIAIYTAAARIKGIISL